MVTFTRVAISEDRRQFNIISGDDKRHMSNLFCTDRKIRSGEPEQRCHIKYVESNDGASWRREGVTAIRDQYCRRMWFLYRGLLYRIVLTESDDGIRLEGMDAHWRVDLSQLGRDFGMIEHPFVFDHDGARYMICIDNEYDKTSFG